jgi:hypothetical protein
MYRGTLPVKTNKNYKETVVSALRLLQHFQLPDKNSRHILRYIHNFCGISKHLCICSSISRGFPNEVLWNPNVPRKPVWETLIENNHQVVSTLSAPNVRMAVQRGNTNNSTGGWISKPKAHAATLDTWLKLSPPLKCLDGWLQVQLTSYSYIT